MQNSEEMSFLDHLEALRWHLVRSVIVIVLFSIVLFANKSFVFDTVIFAPKGADFFTFRVLCKLSVLFNQWLPQFFAKDSMCIGQNLPDLQNISMSGQFMTHITVSIIGGLIVAFPYVIWELWRFISPALKQGELKRTRGMVFFTSVLFITGILFAYYLIAPLSINFLINYKVSSHVINIPTLSTYISTLTTIVLACGIIFELPILIYFLSKAGIVSPPLLKKFRRHAIVASLILSAVITPPDVFSQCLVAIPILFLYEISIYVSKIVLKKNK